MGEFKQIFKEKLTLIIFKIFQKIMEDHFHFMGQALDVSSRKLEIPRERFMQR